MLVVTKVGLMDSASAMRELGFLVIICVCETKIAGMRLRRVPVGKMGETLAMASTRHLDRNHPVYRHSLNLRLRCGLVRSARYLAVSVCA